MKTNFQIFLFFLLVVSSMSCEVEKTLEFNSKSILGHWDIKGGGIISIESNSFSLSAGCNTLFGEVTIKNKNLFFSTIASTRIACQEEISNIEQKLADLLDNKNFSFLIKDDRAELYNTNGEIILILIRPTNVNLINEWSLISLRSNDGVSSSVVLDKNIGIIFLNNSEVKISTACNNGGGNFFEEFNNITFSGLSFTEKSCDQEKNIREQEFTRALSKINSYSILRNILSLEKDDIEYIRFSLKD